MKLRYVILHHPGLKTDLCVEEQGQAPQVIEDRFTWAVAREYCRRSLEERGVEPVIEEPEPNVETFPWIEV